MNHEPSPMTLSDGERCLLGLWAADCAERVLPLFEAKAPAMAATRPTLMDFQATPPNTSLQPTLASIGRLSFSVGRVT